MKLKELVEKYGEYEIYPDSPKHIENAFKDLDSKDDGTLCLCVKKPKPKSVWDLKSKDECWTLDETGGLTHEKYGDGFFNHERREFGNVFLTEEETLKEKERRKVETLLLKFGGRRWFKDGVENWLIVLMEDGLTWFIHNKPIQGVIYFDTEEQAEKAISEIGKQRIKKALFEVR